MIEGIDAVDVGGKTALIGTVLLTVWNTIAKYVNIESINPIVLFVTGVISLLYMVSKWRGQRISNAKEKIELNRIKRLEELEREKDKQNG